MARNIFNTIQVKRPQTSTFDLSHDVKLSLDMGHLVPVACMEVIPGDKWNINSETLLRFAPMVAPLMHKVNVTTHWFFVPNRLVWPNWEKFITANNGKADIPAPPYLQQEVDGQEKMPIVFDAGSLGDYLGLPIDVEIKDEDQVSAIPFAGIAMIYDEYYRDQNLQTALNETYNHTANDVGSEAYLVDGGNHLDSLFLQSRYNLYRSWQHDYFTASLPFAQKGEAVEIPLFPDGIQMPVLRNNIGGENEINWTGTDDNSATQDLNVAGSAPSRLDWLPQDSLYATTTSEQDEGMTAATINDLRRAFKLQEWLEKMARGGSRYIEQILVHFGVKSSDARLQRPEFLGGSKLPVIVSEVLSTAGSIEADTVESLPLGSMGGHGISAGRGSNIRYTAEEHGYIFGIMSVTPLTAYQQGLHRHWTRRSHLDYAWPSFAHIGEQEVLNKELYFDGEDGKNEETFGYVPRYSEYKYMASRVAGNFRDNLAFWHLGRIFDTRPALNEEFIKCEPRTDIFAVQDINSQNLWSHVYHSIRVTRRLPKYGTPTL